MTHGDFGFVFPPAGQSGYEGPNNPSAEFFTGREPSEAIARECIQNSLDAKRDDVEVVRVVFDLRKTSVDGMPGIDTLRVAAAAAVALAGELQGADSLQEAHRTAMQHDIWTLGISDFGTTGLLGSEKIRDEKSPLSILTRGTGASSNQGDRGGSFGIGSAVGVMASSMSTAYYRTRRTGDTSTIVAGYSKLATHLDQNGERRRGEGFLSLRDDRVDFTYLRSEVAFPDFPGRTEPGTDVLIPGYVDAESDDLLHQVRDAVATNFFAAIARGKLIVEGVTPSGSWVLDAEELPRLLSSVPRLHDQVLPYFRALQDPTPSVKDDHELGRMTLYLFEDDSMDRSLGTITMRKPLMTIDLFQHRIPASYAAVLVCSDSKGNEILRKIEPPEHTKWNEKGPRSNGPVVRRLKEFVRTELRSRLRVDSSVGAKVRGLEKFLPKVSAAGPPSVGTGRPGLNEQGKEDESARRAGTEEASYELDASQFKPFKVSVLRPALASPDGAQPVAKGKDSGGLGSARGKRGGALPGTGAEGDGTSRIHASDLSFRSFSPAHTAINVLVLHPKVNATGDLPLITLGVDGRSEDNDLVIEEAVLLDGKDRRRLQADGMVLKDLALIAGHRNTIHVRFNTARSYRLGVKHG